MSLEVIKNPSADAQDCDFEPSKQAHDEFITNFLWLIHRTPCSPPRRSLQVTVEPSFICCEEWCFEGSLLPPSASVALQGLFQGLSKKNKKSYSALFLKVVSPPRAAKPTSNAWWKLYGISAGDKRRQRSILHQDVVCWVVFLLCVLIGGGKYQSESAIRIV